MGGAFVFVNSKIKKDFAKHNKIISASEENGLRINAF